MDCCAVTFQTANFFFNFLHYCIEVFLLFKYGSVMKNYIDLILVGWVTLIHCPSRPITTGIDQLQEPTNQSTYFCDLFYMSIGRNSISMLFIYLLSYLYDYNKNDKKFQFSIPNWNESWFKILLSSTMLLMVINYIYENKTVKVFTTYYLYGGSCLHKNHCS